MSIPISVEDDIEKAPGDRLWYGFDLGALGWLAADDAISEGGGELPDAPAWTLVDESGDEDPADMEIDAEEVEDDVRALAYVTGGTEGKSYILTAVINTENGDTKEASVRLRCIRVRP